MGRGRKTHDEEQAIEKLLKLSSNYLLNNFHKFNAERRYQLSKALIEKRITRLDQNLGEKDGDSYLINIIGSFNGDGKKELTEIDKNRISEARSIVAENLSKKQSVSTN